MDLPKQGKIRSITIPPSQSASEHEGSRGATRNLSRIIFLRSPVNESYPPFLKPPKTHLGCCD
jgi:hypothetical protein